MARFFKKLSVFFIPFIVLVVVIFIIYGKTLHGSFIFDDINSIVLNYGIRDINNLLQIWSIQPLRFLVYFSFAVNYALHRLDVFGYHLVNIWIHIFTSYLVFLFVYFLKQTPRVRNSSNSKLLFLPIFTSLLFAVHPLATQAVSYITQRTTSLAAFFYILSLTFYVIFGLFSSYAKNKKACVFLLFSLISALCAWNTKEMTFTLPVAIFLLECIFFSNRLLRKFLFTGIFIFLLAVVWEEVHFAKIFNIQKIRDDYSLQETIARKIPVLSVTYFATEINVVRTYIRFLFIPVGQNLDHDYPMFASVLDPVWVASLILHLSLIFLAFCVVRRMPFLSFGIFFFYLTLIIESSIIRLDDVMAEHRLYLPLVGFTLAIVSCMYQAFGKRKNLMPVFFLPIFILGVLSYQRNSVWQNGRLMWEDVIQKSPHKARGYFNLGVYRMTDGNLSDAEKLFTIAHKLDPSDSQALNNLGVVREREKDDVGARILYEKGLVVDPRDSAIRNNLVALLFQMQKKAEAQNVLDAAPSDTYPDPYFFNTRGYVYSQQGHFDAAIVEFRKALKLQPDFIIARENLALMLAKTGQSEEAFREYVMVEKLRKEETDGRSFYMPKTYSSLLVK